MSIALLLLLLMAALSHAQSTAAATPPGSFVDVAGSRIYYEECGTGPDAVILLHDGVANSAVWDHAWPAFCKSFHAIRYDRRGYGRSPVTKKPYYEADDIAALVHDRKLTHVALVASSHGGEIAMSFALRYAAYVSDLVLVGPAASGFPYSEHFITRERTTWNSNKVPELIDATMRDPYLIVPGHDAAHKRLREILTASPQDLTHDDMPLPEPPTFPNVQTVRMPILILIGSADIADNHAVAGALVMAIPGSIRLVVPDTGHLMYLEKPNEFFTTVNMFLTAHGFPSRGR